MKKIMCLAIALASGCGRGEPGRVRLEVMATDGTMVIDRGYAWLVGPRRLDVAVDAEAAARLAKLSAEHVGEQVRVVADGELIGALTLREPIREGHFSITLDSDLSSERLRNLAIQLR